MVSTCIVELERFVGSINGDRHRSDSCKSSHEFSLITRWNVHESTVNGSAVFRVVTASIILKLKLTFNTSFKLKCKDILLLRKDTSLLYQFPCCPLHIEKLGPLGLHCNLHFHICHCSQSSSAHSKK